MELHAYIAQTRQSVSKFIPLDLADIVLRFDTHFMIAIALTSGSMGIDIRMKMWTGDIVRAMILVALDKYVYMNTQPMAGSPITATPRPSSTGDGVGISSS